VFGDIGTSPITIQTAFNPNDPLPVPISTDNVYGVVSLIFWSVMIIVTLTYVTLVMRADNDGGGSIMALITLLRRYGGARGRRTAMTLAALGLFGAALFLGETMITPAISPGSDRNSLNRAVRAVLADGGSVLIIDERVADAFAAPADDLERYHYAWAGGRDVVGPGTTIQRDPRDGEPWVRAATFSLLEATRDRGRELAAGGKGKP
jgi:potassium transporter